MTFKNRLALIDLTRREVSIEGIPREFETKFILPRQRAETCPFDGLTFFEDLAYHCDLCGGDPQCISVCTNGAVVIKT